ncbi:MAG: transposase [Ilumatobacteraceae bacterium]
MPRPPRFDPEGGWHHVMNRGADRADTFLCDSDRTEFGQQLADMHDRFGVETHAYCLMSNHYHLLLHCPDGGLSDAMQRLGSLYTRHVNDRIGRDGALFRGRFHGRLIEDERYLVAACRYIHRNALDLPGVDSPDRYRWSSHRTYLGHRAAPSWMRTDVILDHFGGDRAEFDRFVRADESTLARPTATPGDLQRVTAAAELVIAERGLAELHRARALARAVTLVWAADVAGLDRATLMCAFGSATPGALRVAVSRARSTMRSHAELHDVQTRAVGLATTGVTNGV